MELQAEKDLENKKAKFSEEDKLNDELNKDIEENKSRGVFSSWSETRQKRLEKIKQSKERPAAPLLEELKEKPGYKEMKTRKLVERMPVDINAKEASKDDYI